MTSHATLSRRERQIMDVLYRHGRASAAEVMEALPGTPSYSTVRTQLRVLERKGHVRHEEHGVKFIYLPAVPRRAARKSALKHLVETFFDGSVEKVVGALLGGEGVRVSDEQLESNRGAGREGTQAEARWRESDRRSRMTLILDNTLKVSLIVCAGFALSSLLRRRSASVRHWILAATIVSAAAVPLVEPWLPSWRVPARRFASAAADRTAARRPSPWRHRWRSRRSTPSPRRQRRGGRHGESSPPSR